MNYKLIMKISDLEFAIGDYKRGLITERELIEKVRACYAALEKEFEPEVAKKNEER